MQRNWHNLLLEHAAHRSVQGPALWQWPSILSLEAPLIAALWQRLFGAVLGVPVGWRESLLLGLIVWLIYCGDRLLDAQKWGADAPRTWRHRFYAEHRRGLTRLWLLVGVVAFGGCLLWLSPLQLLTGTLLGGALLGYFCGRHLGRPEAHPKELQIAGIFALGVGFIPLLGGGAPLPLGLMTLLFAALIFLNCGYLALWEGDIDVEPAPFRARHPRLERRLPTLALLLLAACAVGGVLSRAYLPLYAALGGSALLLALLGSGASRARLGPAALRVAGDAALLTPLVALLLLHA